MRDESTVRRDARLWVLVAELEALKCESEAMRLDNRSREAKGLRPRHSGRAFARQAERLRELAGELQEV